MAKGSPARKETTALPECSACGSPSFREVGEGLRCEDCGLTQKDPFTAPG